VTMSSSQEETIRAAACPRCCVCGGPGSVAYSGIPDRLFAAPGKWTIVRCVDPSCGLLWLDPMPATDDLHKAYKKYYTHDEGPSRPASALRLPARPGGRLLEIGFGSGTILETLSAAGWRAEGLDFDRVCVERLRAKGFEARLGSLKDAAYPGDSFDAVIMSHVFEHVPDPLALLREVRRVLKPGGLFVALTPNAAACGHRKFRSNWLALDPPRHLHLFSPASLRLALSSVPFSAAKVFTTINGADYIHLASRDLERAGRHVIGAPLDPAERRRGRRFQLREWFLLLLQPDAGEELVVIAAK
jgi:SAM-dependent methyltransferase